LFSFSYLLALHTYLLSFTKRTQPLQDTEQIQKESEAEFDSLWEENKIEGWDFAKEKPKEEGDGIWCSACHKLYSKQTVYDAHLKSKKHLKAVERQQGGGVDNAENSQNGSNGISKAAVNGHDSRSKYRNAARLTHLVTNLLNALADGTLADTKANVERRFSLTARERELELEEARKPTVPPPSTTAQDGGKEEEEEEEKIYNPLKLPLGWDGKPIPYWLYKLHGLGVEYRCEICSDHVYMGRKNFDRHFQVC